MHFVAADWMQQLGATASVGIAALFGAAIGAERELLNRPAGLRTHALLAAAAALLVELTGPLVTHLDRVPVNGVVRADPIRIAEAIVTGVAFIGAGTIFRHRSEDIVEGLTTAASLLLVSALAIAVAVGQLLLATIVTLFSLAVLRIFRRWKHKGH
jgi:putative Mg2+ transporter-C (MgtC) family protein